MKSALNQMSILILVRSHTKNYPELESLSKYYVHARKTGGPKSFLFKPWLTKFVQEGMQCFNTRVFLWSSHSR